MTFAQDKAISGRILCDFRADFQEVPVQIYEKFHKGKGATQVRGFGLMGKLYDFASYVGCSSN